MFKNFFNAFREFAARGNAVDMAVGIIVGAAMTGLVGSLVSDIIMPPIGYIVGRIDFSNIAFHIGHGVTIKIGKFLNAGVSFSITMFAAFLIVRAMRRRPPSTAECPYCKTRINPAATKCPNCCSRIPR